MDNNIKQDAFVQGLEQAAEKYMKDTKHIWSVSTAPRHAFIAGGKWMAQQIYNALKTIAKNNNNL